MAQIGLLNRTWVQSGLGHCSDVFDIVRLSTRSSRVGYGMPMFVADVDAISGLVSVHSTCHTRTALHKVMRTGGANLWASSTDHAGHHRAGNLAVLRGDWDVRENTPCLKALPWFQVRAGFFFKHRKD